MRRRTGEGKKKQDNRHLIDADYIKWTKRGAEPLLTTIRASGQVAMVIDQQEVF